MGSTSAWGTRRTMALLMQVVAVAAFVLFINLPIQVQGAVETDHPNVVDAEGNPVLVGKQYSVVSAVAGDGGGLTLKRRVNNSCPLYVAQQNSETSVGLPALFTVAAGQKGINYSAEIVEEHVNLNVNVAAKTVCGSTAWSVEKDGNSSKRFIKVSDTNSLFQIVKASDGDGYVLYNCPCNNCRLACTKIGIYVDDHENRWLVIDNSAEALRVQFRKDGRVY